MAVKKNDTETTTTEIVVKLSDEALSGITSFDDALKLLQETYGEESIVIASDALGDGFKMLNSDDKHKLVGEGLIFVNWDFAMGKHGEYVYARVVTADNKKYVIIDGSHGIYAQLKALSANKGVFNGLYVANGLRRSDYDKEIDGKMSQATTYYLDTSA